MPILGGRQVGVRGLGFTTAGKPNQVTGLTATDFGTSRAYNNGRIDLSWTAPADNGAPITGYRIERSTDNISYSAISVNTGTTSTSYSDTGLNSNQIYYYKVAAINAVDTGPLSTASNATSTTVPQAPTVTAADSGSSRAYNNGAATVTVSGGATGGKAISSYTATSSPGSFTATSGSPLTVTGLQSATAYTFSVTATNANGTSDATVSNSITATTVPQTPTIGTVTRTNNTTVSVPWTAATGGSAITGVTITSSPSIAISSSGTSSPSTATGSFAQGTGYTFTISLTNNNGTSGVSGSSNSVTPSPIPSLGTWSSSTAYPTGVNFVRGEGNNTVLVAAGGKNSGGTTLSTGYYWNGSSWASSDYPTSLTDIAIGYRSTDERWIGAGGLTATPSNTNGVRYKTSNTGSWTNGGTPIPFSAVLGGVGSIGDNFVLTYTTSTDSSNNYLKTYIGNGLGTWTQKTDLPEQCNQSNMKATTNTTNHNSMFYTAHNSVNLYSTTDVNSWSNVGTHPLGWTSGSGGTSSQGYTYFSYGNFNTTPYRWNGSTFTAQTTQPVYWALAYAGGVQNNYWSIFGNRQSGSDFNTGHYRSLIS